MKTQTFSVPAAKVSRAKEMVAKLNAKAAKIGVPPCEMVIGESRRVSVLVAGKANANLFGNYEIDMPPTYAMETIVDITLTAGPIKIAGWTFAAHVDHRRVTDAENKTREYANLITSTRERELPETIAATIATCAPTCEHCDQDRRRNTTYFLVSDEGAWKQVGSTCIADFLGHDPHALLWMLTRINALADDMTDADGDFLSGGHRSEFDLRMILVVAARCIRRHGWVSAKMKNERGCGSSTKDMVLQYMEGDQYAGEETAEDFAGDDAMADLVHAWIKELAPKNDYEWNLATLSKLDYLYFKDLGIAVSAVASYQNMTAKRTEREALSGHSEHVGEIGKRMRDIEAKVLAVRMLDGYMGGTTQLVTMVAGGNVLKSFYSGSYAFESGATIRITGTVKKHETYRERKETLLTRLAISA
jgi:hypothetical protein